MKKYNADAKRVFDFYNGNYEKYGYSVKSLAWNKGKQNIRFSKLLQSASLKNGVRILDIGCGFGDLIKYINLQGVDDFQYTGIDLVENFIFEASKIYIDDSQKRFVCGDFLQYSFGIEKYDIIIASGIFNFKMRDIDNYENIRLVLNKAYELCSEDGVIAFDFQSDKVDYIANDIVFHNSPEKVISIAYEFSRNILFDNSYMPFEFSLIINKNDSFNRETTTFNKFIDENSDKYEMGIF